MFGKRTVSIGLSSFTILPIEEIKEESHNLEPPYSRKKGFYSPARNNISRNGVNGRTANATTMNPPEKKLFGQILRINPIKSKLPSKELKIQSLKNQMSLLMSTNEDRLQNSEDNQSWCFDPTARQQLIKKREHST